MKKKLIITTIGIVLVLTIFFVINKNKKEIILDNVEVKESINKKITFAMYKETNNNTYEEVEGNIFPTTGYILNIPKSKCIDESGNEIENILSYDISNKKVIVDTNKTSYCYLYFAKEVVEFAYTGSEQEFTVPLTGTYKVELWGAGGLATPSRVEVTKIGLGAYTYGTINLVKDRSLFVYVGQAGTVRQQLFNGGGVGEQSGGGATDIRTISGNWDNINSLRSRIMVSAGASGGFITMNTSNQVPGHAGGLIGYDSDAIFTISNSHLSPSYSGKGATQTSGGSSGSNTNLVSSIYGYIVQSGFGYGGYGYAKGGSSTSSGGGSGWYGGGHGIHNGETWPGGGGGSSYISGHTGCVGVTSATNTTPKSGCTTGTTDIECSKSWTGYVFTNTLMIDGAGYKWTTVKGSQQQMPKPDGTLYPLGQGHTGNGYAKITFIG